MVSISFLSLVTTLNLSPPFSNTNLVLPSMSGLSTNILMRDMDPGYTKLIPAYNT